MHHRNAPTNPGQPGPETTRIERHRPWRTIRADIEAAETRVVLGLLCSTEPTERLAEIYGAIGDGSDLCDHDLRLLYIASHDLYREGKPSGLVDANAKVEAERKRLDVEITEWINTATNFRANQDTVQDVCEGARRLRGYFDEKRRLAQSGEPIGDSGPATTDMGNGERLAHRYRNHVRHCFERDGGRWFVWDGRRWAVDRQGEIVACAKATARSILAEAANEDDKSRREALIAWAKASESKARIEAMVSLARSEPGISILPENLDLDPWAFNVINGTLDLRTGELRPHRREDMLTKLSPVEYDPNAKCPLWETTLETFLPDKEVRSYFRRLAGYALTGVIRDHVFPILHGSGANGKSTLLGTLLDVWGADYGLMCPHDFLAGGKGQSRHPTELADLAGKRLAVAVETEDGARLKESLLKALTGGDMVRARHMKENFSSFKPTHKIFVATNHRPAIRGSDPGIWRRMAMIPFSVQMSADRAIRDMPERLKAEHAGILAWAVRGCLEWQQIGLNPPKSVTDATAEYRSEEDVIGRFIQERCLQVSEVSVQAGHLYAAYKAWAESSGFGVLSLTRFGQAITEKGFEKTKGNYVVYLGLKLQTDGGTPTNADSDTPDTYRHFSRLSGDSASRDVGHIEKVSQVSQVSETTVPTEAEIAKSVASWPEARREAFLDLSVRHRANGYGKEASDRMAFRELLSAN